MEEEDGRKAEEEDRRKKRKTEGKKGRQKKEKEIEEGRLKGEGTTKLKVEHRIVISLSLFSASISG